MKLLEIFRKSKRITKAEPVAMPELKLAAKFPRGLRLRVLDAGVLTADGQRATRMGELSVDEARHEDWPKVPG